MSPVPFQAHVELLRFFLAHRGDIVERIQGLLNAQRKPIEYLRNRSLLSDHLGACFSTLAGVTPGQSGLGRQLEEAHWVSGFRPREMPGLYNGLADPAEMMTRVFHLWQQTRWPGRNGRLRYAHTLFNLYVLRSLELLSLRLWDNGSNTAGRRLSQLQGVLDQLRAGAPADQPVFVRDARWLIQLAQSPATDDLGAYFDVAEKVAVTLPERDRIEVHKAGVRMTSGHLRSQTRYLSGKRGVPLDDPSLILITRNSNALDFALLVQDLVPLLEAYERAQHDGDARNRLELADAICQGMSADPELFVNRIVLLGAYSMIEHLFITTNPDASVVYTSMGRRHLRLVEEYQARIDRMSTSLLEDCQRFRPAAGAYSPYGVLYGFSSHLLEHMALKASQPDAMTQFGLEDVFVSEGDNVDKLAWVTGWRTLPHLPREVTQLFEYPRQFAEDMFMRFERALRRRVLEGAANHTARTGHLVILSGDTSRSDSRPIPIADLAARYIESSDAQLVAAKKAVVCDEFRLLEARREGKYLLSYETSDGWVGITKDVLTDVLGAGNDAKTPVLSSEAAESLKLMCPGLVITPD